MTDTLYLGCPKEQHCTGSKACKLTQAPQCLGQGLARHAYGYDQTSPCVEGCLTVLMEPKHSSATVAALADAVSCSAV